MGRARKNPADIKQEKQQPQSWSGCDAEKENPTPAENLSLDY